MNEETTSQKIDTLIKEIGGWRGETLASIRNLIKEADPDVVETLKWAKASTSTWGIPIWEHDGIICTGEHYKDKVKLTFMKGASLEDSTKLFNSSFGGNTRRSLDIFEGDVIDEDAFKALIREAVELNTTKKSGKKG